MKNRRIFSAPAERNSSEIFPGTFQTRSSSPFRSLHFLIGSILQQMRSSASPLRLARNHSLFKYLHEFEQATDFRAKHIQNWRRRNWRKKSSSAHSPRRLPSASSGSRRAASALAPGIAHYSSLALCAAFISAGSVALFLTSAPGRCSAAP